MCSVFQWGCTVTNVPAQLPVEHFRSIVLQNIMTDQMLHSVIIIDENTINASFQVPVRAEPGVHPAGHHPPRHGTLHESRARVQRAPAQSVLQNWRVPNTYRVL